MSSTTPLLDILSTHLPETVSSVELSSLSSSQSRSAVETLLAFALGGDCPTRLIDARQEWSRNQSAALKVLHDTLGAKSGAKRARDSQDSVDPSAKRQKTHDDDDDDSPLFTLPSISTTSPVRKKVDVTIHKCSIRFVHPATRALESSIPLASISRVFLLPTRGKTKSHWTVVLLSTDVPDKTKAPPSSAQQVIFGLDALSAAAFETTSYSSDTTTPTSTSIVAKGEETVSSVRRLLSHIPVSLLEPSATVFRSACATPKAGDGAAGIDAYLSAKSGTLWFFDSGILWGESKPCEYWAVSDLIPKDGVRTISATGRTCSVILARKSAASGDPDADADSDEVVETVFSMVDGREQDPIGAWVRNRKHLFGKPRATLSASAPLSHTASSVKKARSSEHQQPNGSIKGPAWDDSDPDDEDFEGSSEDLESGSSDSEESRDGSGDDSDGRSGGTETGDELEAEGGKLQEAHHPLLRPGAVPRMSKAAMDMVVDMVHDDFIGDPSEEEDELEE